MLIILDESLANQATPLSAAEIGNLEELLFYHSKQYHYVGATRKTANSILLALENVLNSRSLNTLKLLTAQSDGLPKLLSSVKMHTVVKKSELAGMFAEAANGGILWSCDLKYAAKWFSQPSRIIGEHLTDAKIFKNAGRFYALANQIESRAQNSSLDMSGGSGNAHTVLSNRLQEGSSPVLCIIDSDKITATHDSSESVKKCVDVIDDLKGIAYFLPLAERELENVIPDSIIANAILTLPTSKDRDVILDRAALAKQLRQEAPEIYKHIDLKEGTCATWAAKKGVEGFFSGTPILAPCTCCATCHGFIAPRIFDDLLNRVCDYLISLSDKKLLASDITKAEQSWVYIGALAFSVALSNNVRAT